jgi:hypothetical protein
MEKAMGARCMEDESWPNRRDRPSQITRYCIGSMPQKLREVLTAIPDGEMELLPQAIKQSTEEPVMFVALRGLGREPDFLVETRKWWLRSFESAAPNMTVYWVNGWFKCRSDSAVRETTDNVRCFETSRVRTSRFYRMSEAGELVDVTLNVLPPDPIVAPAMRRYQARYGYKDEELYLDKFNLQFVPLMRWVMRIEPEHPLPASERWRAYKQDLAHFGFLMWDGERFKLVPRVPRALWPCSPVAAGRPYCTSPIDSPTDKFVIDEPQSTAKGTAHDR